MQSNFGVLAKMGWYFHLRGSGQLSLVYELAKQVTFFSCDRSFASIQWICTEVLKQNLCGIYDD